MSMSRSALSVLVLLVLSLCPAGIAFGQVAGSVSGVVRDAEGNTLSGVSVVVSGAALQRESLKVVTDAEGAYRVAPLPPGVYALRFELDSFAPQGFDAVRVGVNARVTLDWTLLPEAVAETVEVRGALPLMEIQRSELATRIEEESIDNLPLQSRNAEDLVILVPGVTPRPAEVRDQQFSIFGERPSATSFRYDGVDNNDPLDGGSFQRYAQDAIQEFEVITTGYQAEFGRAQAGVVNVLTRSGTNATQGRAFFFKRNDSWDSSNVAGQEAPDLSREQWGLSLGGKVRRDRSFFFVAGEFLDEQRGRNIDFSAVPQWVQDGISTVGGEENFAAGPQIDDQTLLGKIDLLPSDEQRWTLSLNSTTDDADGDIPSGIAGALVLPSAARLQEQDSLGLTLNQSTVLSQRGVLDSNFRLLDGQTGTNLDKTERAEAVLLLFRSGFIQTGAQLPGGRAERNIDRFSLGQSYSHLAGRHELKFGYEYLDTSLDGFEEVSNDVEYSAYFLFPNAIDLNEELFQRFGFEHAAARFFFLSANPDGSLDLDINNEDVALYGQDKLQIGDNVIVDVGLRYDQASLFDGDDDNFAPRFGLTWDVGGKHRTVVKASAGVFYDQNALIASTGVPEKGGFFGDTLFASMYAAYEALSDKMRSFLSGLTAIHESTHLYRGSYYEKAGGGAQRAAQERASGRAHPPRDRPSGPLRQRRLHHQDRRHEPRREPSSSRLPLPPHRAPRFSGPLPMAAELDGLLGQSLRSASRGVGLLAADPHTAFE